MLNNPEEIMFLAIDGDDVGPQLRSCIIANDLHGAAQFSTGLEQYFTHIKLKLIDSGFQIVFCGGDSILASANVVKINKILSDLTRGICSISAGIGETAEVAYLALQLAKARGKSQAVWIQGASYETVRIYK